MSYTSEQLIDALVKEYEYICHDDFNPEVDLSVSEYQVMLEEMSFDDLVLETGTDEEFTLDDFMLTYGNIDPWNLRGRLPMQPVKKQND